MYPIYHYEEGRELPETGNYFLVAGNGLFLHKDNGLFSGFVPVQNISHLDDFEGPANLKTTLPKIPPTLVMQTRKFFADVFAKHRSEACVLLAMPEEKTDQYTILVPQQAGHHSMVRYRREPTPGFKLVGTIHSHCDFQAFHSSVDDADEEHFDGLHITFGHVDKTDGITISASIVLNGQRQNIDPQEILDGIQEKDDRYLILPPENPIDFDQLQQEIDSWMTKVN